MSGSSSRKALSVAGSKHCSVTSSGFPQAARVVEDQTGELLPARYELRLPLRQVLQFDVITWRRAIILYAVTVDGGKNGQERRTMYRPLPLLGKPRMRLLTKIILPDLPRRKPSQPYSPALSRPADYQLSVLVHPRIVTNDHPLVRRDHHVHFQRRDLRVTQRPQESGNAIFRQQTPATTVALPIETGWRIQHIFGV